MKKRSYQTLRIKITKFKKTDVVTFSGGSTGDSSSGGNWGEWDSAN